MDILLRYLRTESYHYLSNVETFNQGYDEVRNVIYFTWYYIIGNILKLPRYTLFSCE